MALLADFLRYVRLRRKLKRAREISDDPEGVIICTACGNPYHKSYGSICGECSGAGIYD